MPKLFFKGVLFVFTTLTLSSCGGMKHPKMLSFTPASVVIDYSDGSLHEATSLAQQFCSTIKKDAQYVSTEKSGMISVEKQAFFNCVERRQENDSRAATSSTMPIINNFK